MKKKLLNLSVLIANLMLLACASTSSEVENSKAEKAESPKASSQKNSSPSAQTSQTSSLETPKASGRKTVGSEKLVTVSLVNDGAFEAGIPEQVLSEVLLSVDDLVRKEPDNLPLLITYMGILRLYGQNPALLSEIEKKAGSSGSKNIWYLIESSYNAMSRKDLAFADYLLDKAAALMEDYRKKGTYTPTIHAALNHAVGVRFLIEGKTSEAVAKMRAKEAEVPFLPSLLTTGFLSLKAGDYEGSEKTFRTAVAIAPNSLNSKMGLATSLRVRGKTSESIALWQGVYRTKPTDRRVVWNYALALSDGDDTSRNQALGLLDKYFQLPGSYSDLDAKANTLINKLNNLKMTQPQTAPKTAEKPSSAAAAATQPPKK